MTDTVRRRACRSGSGASRLVRLALAGIAAAALVACGGGDATDDPTAAAGTSRARALAAAPASGGGVLINELVAGAWHGPKDEDGDSEDWVELYNPGTAAVDLSGYGLSNKTATPFLWVFPAGTQVAAKGYLTVWLSKKDRLTNPAALHANFNLDNGGDSVYLTASNATAAGIMVDSATPPLIGADQSWCRMPNGVATSPFSVCVQATRNAANAGTAYASILAKPTLSVPSGFYAGIQTVTINGPVGATLRYTIDGSEPTATSTVYAAPLNIGTSTVLRVGAFAAGAAPSLVETGTYVIDAALAGSYAGLKAMMVAMSPSDQTAYQANDQTRDFRANFEFITGGTTSVFRMDGEGSAGGQLGSGDSPQRTMNVKGIDAFGPKSFPGVLWADKPGIKSVRKFRLRNGSNDWASAHLRDQLSQRLGAPGPNIVASSTSVAMFINGKYYGLMDLREREEETIPSSNLGIDKDFVDYIYDPLLGAQEIKNGGAAALASYQSMNNYVTGNDMTVAANYARAKTLLNPESLAWDWALHMFHANYDWPGRNVHVWRSPEVDGRWTWRAHDMDFAFGRYTGVGYNMNGSFGAGGSAVMSALLRNTEFRNLYLNTVADQMNVMSPSAMTTTLDAMAAEMRPYIGDFYAKNNMGPASNWETRLAEIRTWFNEREPVYDGHNRTQFGLGVRQPLTVAVNDLAMGSVKVNQIATQKFMNAASPVWNGRYYPGIPVTLEAKPKPGYAFVGWQGASTVSDKRITQTLSAPAAASFPTDNFSIRWSGSVEAPVSGPALLQTVADDGTRVWFDGRLVIDNWIPQGATPKSATVSLVAGTRHAIVVEYFEQGGDASARLEWQLPGSAATVVIPTDRLFPQGQQAAPAGALGSGLTAQYFANISLAGNPTFVRNEPINFNWGTAGPDVTAAPVQLTAVFAPSGAPAAPTFAPVAAQAWRTGDIVALPVAATDPGGYDLTYSAKSLPKGLNINPANGMIYGRLTTPGTYATVVTATNGTSSGTQTIQWTVTDRNGSGLLGTSPDSGPVNTPPTVALTSPGAGATIAEGVAIVLTASASDSNGTVAKVDFYDGATLLGTATTSPYTYTWSGATFGTHSLTARATDNAGAVTTSAVVTLSITSPVAAPPATAVACAAENQSCTLPSGAIATVWYGATGGWAQRQGVSGTVACSNATFGDPLQGTVKSCVYVVTGALPVNVPPTATLTSPPPGAQYVTGSPITLGATAADSDGTVARVEFYDGSALIGTSTSAPYSVVWSTAVTGTHSLTARAIDNTGAGTTSAAVSVTVNVPATGTGTGLLGRYYASNNLSGNVALQRVEAVNFNWSLASPGTGVPADNFSARWVGEVEAPVAGSYQFQTNSDDGVRVWVNGQLAINNWTAHSAILNASGAITLAAGQRVGIVVEYQEFSGYSVMQLQWKTPTSAAFTAIPAERLYAPSTSTGTGLVGQYHANADFTTPAALVRTELPALTIGAGAGPVTGFPTSGWGVRWEGVLRSPLSGAHVLQATIRSDDGVRVWLNGNLVVDNWVTPSTTVKTATLTLPAGASTAVRIEFRDQADAATFALAWQQPGSTTFQAIPLFAFSPQ